MLLVTVLSVNLMISCSALSCVLVGSVEFSPVANYKSKFTRYKKVCSPKRLLPHDVKCCLFQLFSFSWVYYAEEQILFLRLVSC